MESTHDTHPATRNISHQGGRDASESRVAPRAAYSSTEEYGRFFRFLRSLCWMRASTPSSESVSAA